MRNIVKVAVLSSIITAALVYVVLEWKPLRPETSRPPEVSWASSPSAPTPVSSASLTTPAGTFSEDEKNNIDIYQRYRSGVVNITTTTLAFDFFFQAIPQQGTGSGAVIDMDGRIITNYHVIENARRLEVTLEDKSKYQAKVIGIDPNHDLAVIQIDAPKAKLKPIPIGTSDNLLVGQKVLAIGNPYGLERTLTTGIISSLGRSIQAENGRRIDDVIQTDAAINPGNSGGPLLNTAGQIIGINTAILSPSNSGSIGIGFAIAANTVKEITGSLITKGYVPRPYLGLKTVANLADYPSVVNALRLATDHGLIVTDVVNGSPAQRAGIRIPQQEVQIGNYRVPTGGDIILAVSGNDVGSEPNLNNILDKFKPGDRVNLTVLRNGAKIDVPVVLGEAPRQ